MAKDKKTELKDCSTCRYGKIAEGTIYCKLRLFDENVLKSSGIVTKQDCVWFELKSIDNLTRIG